MQYVKVAAIGSSPPWPNHLVIFLQSSVKSFHSKSSFQTSVKDLWQRKWIQHLWCCQSHHQYQSVDCIHAQFKCLKVQLEFTSRLAVSLLKGSFSFSIRLMSRDSPSRRLIMMNKIKKMYLHLIYCRISVTISHFESKMLSWWHHFGSLFLPIVRCWETSWTCNYIKVFHLDFQNSSIFCWVVLQAHRCVIQTDEDDYWICKHFFSLHALQFGDLAWPPYHWPFPLFHQKHYYPTPFQPLDSECQAGRHWVWYDFNQSEPRSPGPRTDMLPLGLDAWCHICQVADFDFLSISRVTLLS